MFLKLYCEFKIAPLRIRNGICGNCAIDSKSFGMMNKNQAVFFAGQGFFLIVQYHDI